MFAIKIGDKEAVLYPLAEKSKGNFKLSETERVTFKSPLGPDIILDRLLDDKEYKPKNLKDGLSQFKTNKRSKS